MTHSRLCVAASLALLFSAGSARSDEHLADHLAGLSWPELESLYRGAEAGTHPTGFYAGRAVYEAGRPLSRVRGAVTDAAWEGKHFRCGEMVNQWRRGEAIRAKVYHSTSWLDGRPSIILDYRDTSVVWGRIRDEIREVAPGVYVGIMYAERKGCPKMKAFFVLRAACPCE